MTTMLLNKL